MSLRRVVLILVSMLMAAGIAAARPPGPCAGEAGCRGGPRAGHGAHGDDHAGFHALLDARDRIRRDVTQLPDGVETLTESDDPAVAEAIRTHVRAMYARLEEGRPIHARDPLFAELFRHADAIAMTMEPTPAGIRVRETSTDPWVVKLIQAHADVVNRFLANGHAEMRRNHPLPPR